MYDVLVRSPCLTNAERRRSWPHRFQLTSSHPTAMANVDGIYTCIIGVHSVRKRGKWNEIAVDYRTLFSCYNVKEMSCLFDSLSVYLPYSASEIRRKICDYLEENNTIVEGLDTHSILEQEHAGYVPWMRDQSTWGGAIEIKAACDIWNVAIQVHNAQGLNSGVVRFTPNTDGHSTTDVRTLDLHWNGAHYWAASPP